MNPVEYFALAQVTTDPGGRSMPAVLALGYDEADPFAVRLRVPTTDGPVSWHLARGLLARGGGIGDVAVAWESPTVRVVLHNPPARAVLALTAEDVARFLNATYRHVPAGHEHTHIDWPAELATLTARGNGDRP